MVSPDKTVLRQSRILAPLNYGVDGLQTLPVLWEPAVGDPQTQNQDPQQAEGDQGLNGVPAQKRI